MQRFLAVLLLGSLPLFAQTPAQQPSSPDQSAKPTAQPSSATPQANAPAEHEHSIIMTKQGEKQPQPGANLPATTPVITIQGLCSPSAATAKSAPAKGTADSKSAEMQKAGCSTVITKAQFEKIVDAVVPKARRAELPPMALSQIAHQFAMLMVMAQKGEQKGVQKDPNVQEQLRLSREQVLAQAYNQKLQDEATPSDAEIAKYYNENPSSFEEVTLQRLYIPKSVATQDKPANPDAEKAAAQKLQERAAAGEDMNKLEKEAFANQPNPQSAPSADMGARRRGSLPPDQESAVFALNVGQVSSLLENPAGWYVYKVTAKRKLPLTDVKDEISRKMQQQKYMDARNAITNAVETKLNDAYFGAPEQSEHEMPPGMRMPHGPQSKKPETPQPNPQSPKQ